MSSNAVDRDVRDWLGRANQALMTEDHGVPFPSVGQYEVALAALDAALRLAPDDARARRTRGHVLNGFGDALATAGRDGEAVAAYEESRRLVADGTDGHFYPHTSLDAWCEALRALGRDADVVRVCDAALQAHAAARTAGRGGFDWAARYAALHRVGALSALGRDGEALDAVDRLVAADPADYEGLAARGVLLHRLGCHAEAVAAYDRALALGPRRPLQRGASQDELRHWRALAIAAGHPPDAPHDTGTVG